MTHPIWSNNITSILISWQEIQKKREEEIEKLRNELTEISSQLESLSLDIKKMDASKQQVSFDLFRLLMFLSSREHQGTPELYLFCL